MRGVDNKRQLPNLYQAVSNEKERVDQKKPTLPSIKIPEHKKVATAPLINVPAKPKLPITPKINVPQKKELTPLVIDKDKFQSKSSIKESKIAMKPTLPSPQAAIKPILNSDKAKSLTSIQFKIPQSRQINPNTLVKAPERESWIKEVPDQLPSLRFSDI